MASTHSNSDTTGCCDSNNPNSCCSPSWRTAPVWKRRLDKAMLFVIVLALVGEMVLSILGMVMPKGGNPSYIQVLVAGLGFSYGREPSWTYLILLGLGLVYNMVASKTDTTLWINEISTMVQGIHLWIYTTLCLLKHKWSNDTAIQQGEYEDTWEPQVSRWALLLLVLLLLEIATFHVSIYFLIPISFLVGFHFDDFFYTPNALVSSTEHMKIIDGILFLMFGLSLAECILYPDESSLGVFRIVMTIIGLVMTCILFGLNLVDSKIQTILWPYATSVQSELNRIENAKSKNES